ncbi:MAG: helix-turn-helix domain-containing protein [Gemmatimonadota bacterium]|nr:helix-turn-helix domain-containing protein [Gemmatimonadota bacterium]
MKASTPKWLRPGYKGEIDGMPFEVSSGNVFRDLGLPDPEMRLAKSRLAGEINSAIKAKGWTQKRTASELGTSQPTISLLKKGMLRSITYDRLISWLMILNRNVTIRVSPAAKNATVEVVVIPRGSSYAHAARVSERKARKYAKGAPRVSASRARDSKKPR